MDFGITPAPNCLRLQVFRIELTQVTRLSLRRPILCHSPLMVVSQFLFRTFHKWNKGTVYRVSSHIQYYRVFFNNKAATDICEGHLLYPQVCNAPCSHTSIPKITVTLVSKKHTKSCRWIINLSKTRLAYSTYVFYFRKI